MKTRKHVLFTIILTTLVIMAGSCSDEPSEIQEKTKLSLAFPSQETYADGYPKIIFRNDNETDEETLARQKVSEEWNRNLYLRGGSSCILGECVENYGKCP